MRRSTIILAVSILILAGASASCSATRSPSAKATARGAAVEQGALQLVSVAQRIEDNRIHLDVTVGNPHAEAASGVRLLYRILVSNDPESLEIARSQEEVAVEIAAGAQATVSMLLPPQAGQRGGFGTFLHAHAIRLGTKTLPLPPNWRAAGS